MENTENLVELDTLPIKKYGGSTYLLIPIALQRNLNVQPGDMVTYLKSSDSTDVVLRFKRIRDDSDVS